ncbi:MAG: MFS transporter [Dehalococcoidia bacterium]|nr:MFS transporter [Dehalococcoidia bacterium]
MGLQTTIANGKPQRNGANGGALRAFSYTQFRLLWLASLISMVSFFMVMIARGWLVLQLTNSPFMLTAVQGVSMLPMAVLPPFGGVIADRLNRKMILMVGEAVNLFALVLLTALLFADLLAVWHLFALSVLSGATFALAMPTRAATVPDLVGVAEAPSAVALFTTIFSTASLVGPFVAGYALKINPDQMGWAFLAATVLAAPALGLLARLRLPLQRSNGMPQASVVKSLAEGMAYVKASRLLIGLFMVGLVFALFGMPYMTLMPVFARDILHAGPEGLGQLAGVGGAGAIAGSLVVAVYSKPRQLQWLMIAGGLGFGLGVIAFAYSTLFALSLTLSLALGFLQQIFATTNFTLVNIAPPPHLRGRVMGIRFIVMGTGTLGMFLLGWLAEVIGPTRALAASGVLGVVLLVGVVVAFPALRRLTAELEAPTPSPVGGSQAPVVQAR